MNGARILILGVAYKPSVDDMRESPALDVMKQLEDRGARVQFHDPYNDRIRLDSGSTVRHSRFTWNGLAGLHNGADGTLIEFCEFDHNGWGGFSGNWSRGGAKVPGGGVSTVGPVPSFTNDDDAKVAS